MIFLPYMDFVAAIGIHVSETDLVEMWNFERKLVSNKGAVMSL